ncbi:MAG: hypothetical protein AB7N76_11595 [Planctomycetota bacterium]
MRRTLSALVCAALLVGCTSQDTPEGEQTKVTTYLKPLPNQTVEPFEFSCEWEDLPRNDKGIVNAVELAKWVTERFDKAQFLLRLEPPARVQAGELLEHILKRAPDASRPRLLLAQLRFADAAWWFLSTDAWAYQIDWLLYYKTAPEDPKGENGRRLTKEELDEAIKRAEPYVKEGNEKIRAAATVSLAHFLRYRAQRPDDKSVVDYLWKLYFYLQRYEEALEWLEYLLAEFDRQEVPESDPLRKKYEVTRTLIHEYMAKLELAKDDLRRQQASPLPWRDKQLRAEQRLMLSEGKQ